MTKTTFAKLFTLPLTSLLVAAVPAVAQADDAAGDNATTVSKGPAVATATAADPNMDRGLLLPTAMTQPAGSITYNNYELLLHGFTYGITDNLQTSVTVLSPITSDMPFFGFGSLKWRLSPTERIHVAAQASVTYGHAFSGDDAAFYSAGTGAFVSGCLREDCSSLLSASVTYQLAYVGGSNGDAVEPANRTAHLVVYGGSLVHRVANHIKLLGEITSATGRSSTSDFDNMPGVLASYGVRFHTANLAGDIGFVKPLMKDESDPFIMGLPFVNVSYRWK